eukprot:TRINITY_DN0_c1163_g1_i1.p1 TRINITY_DN0_c1163_g1~~TRINITY_DN0_c1163_g1_i1.p1  ORF type:complete len:155 (+),score=61.40 TRINITY_DN0_c1163_g1_i1:55-519(+)
MTFKNFVQIGRVVYINYGPLAGRLAVIVDVIDQNRALVDGPGFGVDRQSIPFRRVALTKFRISLSRGISSARLQKHLEKFDLKGKWAKTSLAQRLAIRKKRALLNDFERFKVQLLRQKFSRLARQHARVLAKSQPAAGGKKAAAPAKKAAEKKK